MILGGQGNTVHYTCSFDQQIQKFAGALQGQRARKGIFITTGNFSNDAKEYISKIDSKIVPLGNP